MKNYSVNKIRQVLSERGLLYPLDVALVGATGVGKSSTLNAIFGEDVAKVGTGVDPETQNVQGYLINDVFRVHDSAGLGDGLSADQRHKRNLTDLLLKTITINGDTKPDGFIDLVLVILDGASRDLGTSYQLLEQVILQCISSDRVIVAINQADVAMKGRHWDNIQKKPEITLLNFLEEKALSTQSRIKEATGLNIKKPVFYSAEYNYNIDKLLDHIVSHIPSERRRELT